MTQLTPEEERLLDLEEAPQLRETLKADPQATPAGAFYKGAQRYGKEMMEDLGENWPRYTGATAGAIVGGIPGAAAGGAAGELAKIEYEKRVKGIPPEGFTADAPEAIREAEEVAWAGLKSLGEEIGGRAFLAPFKPILNRAAPFRSKLTPEGQLAWDTLEKYMPFANRTQTISRSMRLRKPPFLPSEITDARILDLADNIAENAWVGGGRIANYKLVRDKAIGEMVDDLGRQFGEQLGEADLGELIVQNIHGKWDAFREVATKPLYNTIEAQAAPEIIKVPIKKVVETNVLDSAGKPITKTIITGYRDVAQGGARVSIKGLKEWMIANHKQRISKALKGIPGSPEAGHNIVDSIMALPDEVDYLIAKELRTQMRVISDSFSVVNKKAKAIGLANKMEGKLTTAIEQGLENFDPNLAAMWKDANAIYKSGGKQYNNRFLRSLIDQVDHKDESSKVIKMIFQNKNTNRIKSLKKAVDTATFNKAKGWYLHQTLSEAIPKQGTVPSGLALERKFFGAAGMGEHAMKEIFTPQEIGNIKGVIAALKTAQARQAEGQGSMLIQFLQAGSVGGIFLGKWEKVAWPILILPEVWARLATNPVGSRALTQALLVPDPAPGLLLRLSNAGEAAFEEIKKERKQKLIQMIESLPDKGDMPF